MNGWTEPQQQIDARTMRRALNEGARNLYLRQTTETDADVLHDCIFAAEIADEADRLDEVDTPDPERERQEVLEIAEMFGCEFLFEQSDPVQLPQSPHARDPFPQSSEYDVTPCEDMPVIDFDNIEEIPFS